MALLLPLAHPTGAQPEYWRIVQATIHYDRNEVVIDMAGYLNQAARDAGAQPLTSIQVVTTVDQFPDVRGLVYDTLDVIENPLQLAVDLD